MNERVCLRPRLHALAQVMVEQPRFAALLRAASEEGLRQGAEAGPAHDLVQFGRAEREVQLGAIRHAWEKVGGLWKWGRLCRALESVSLLGVQSWPCMHLSMLPAPVAWLGMCGIAAGGCAEQ